MTVTLDEDGTGFWHWPDSPNGVGLVLTHGAGGNVRASLLEILAVACCEAGITVKRYTLPFRQRRPSGPPLPAGAAQDRAGLLDAARRMRQAAGGSVVLAGHSYGGRQASILASEVPDSCERLLLLSYPLHPPGKPGQLRTEHFPAIQVPALFVSGTRDEFGTQAEFDREIPSIPAEVRTNWIEGAGHDLKKGKFDLKALVDFVVFSFEKFR